jgi:hypothetical protein
LLIVFLQSERSSIVKRWVELTLETYTQDQAGFLAEKAHEFLSPVERTITTEIATIYDGLLVAADPTNPKPSLTTLRSSLESILRIHAVQNFTPTQAVRFVFLSKQAIMEQQASVIFSDPANSAEWCRLAQWIDALALQAFDVYMEQREKILTLRVKEITDQTARLLERTSSLYKALDSTEPLPHPKKSLRYSREEGWR